jgi:hypothetical protein
LDLSALGQGSLILKECCPMVRVGGFPHFNQQSCGVVRRFHWRLPIGQVCKGEGFPLFTNSILQRAHRALVEKTKGQQQDHQQAQHKRR